jgi:hypothetical protein
MAYIKYIYVCDTFKILESLKSIKKEKFAVQMIVTNNLKSVAIGTI